MKTNLSLILTLAAILVYCALRSVGRVLHHLFDG